MRNQKITVKGTEIVITRQKEGDYISLTDIAKHKNTENSRMIVAHWLRSNYTLEFLGIWEQIHNPNFNVTEFGYIKSQSGANSFAISSKQWIEKTNAIGIISKTGRYGGGTFAHKDIAFEFASWISAEFKLYLIKEFQRLQEQENDRLSLDWDIKRTLTKINYKIHTDAIKEHLIPNLLSPTQINITYASEADVLNKALFGKTAKEWATENPKEEGNMRDYASVTQLVCLANLESLNAEFIRMGLQQPARLKKLNEIAIIQMRSLLGNPTIKKLSS